MMWLLLGNTLLNTALASETGTQAETAIEKVTQEEGETTPTNAKTQGIAPPDIDVLFWKGRHIEGFFFKGAVPGEPIWSKQSPQFSLMRLWTTNHVLDSSRR